MSDGNTPNERSSKSSRGCLGALIAVILLPILAYGTIKFLQRPDHKPTFHAQVTVDVEVNGMPVHIERVITCQTFATGDSIQISLLNFWKTLTSRRETQWVSIPRAFGEVLPDGSALMVRTPYFCGRERNPDGSFSVEDGVNDRTPIIGWTPDATKPETIEFYMSDAFKTTPSARFKNFSIETKLVEDMKASPIDQFAWFSGLYHPEALRKGPDENGNYPEDVFWGLSAKEKRSITTIRYMGFAGWRLTPEDWQGKIHGLDDMLHSIKRAGAVPANNYIYEVEKLIQQRFDLEHVNIGAVVVPQQRWGGLRSRWVSWGTTSQNNMALLSGLQEMYGFPTVGNEVWIDGPISKGHIQLQMIHSAPQEGPIQAPQNTQKKLPSYIVHLGGRDFDQAYFNEKLFFDPTTRQLFYVEPYYFSTQVSEASSLADP